MQPRRKPIPVPIARATSSRPLIPAGARTVLPTVAALLAIAALGCDGESAPIGRDHPTVVRTEGAPAKHFASRPFDPAQPLPGMAALEDPPPPPPPPPPPQPTTTPYPVKGGAKAVHPKPIAPRPPGGIKAITPPPIMPRPTAPKLAGDVAAVVPETT